MIEKKNVRKCIPYIPGAETKVTTLIVQAMNGKFSYQVFSKDDDMFGDELINRINMDKLVDLFDRARVPSFENTGQKYSKELFIDFNEDGHTVGHQWLFHNFDLCQ